MRAGRLRHRVAIYKPASNTPNEYGETLAVPSERVLSNALDGNFWASVEPASGTETDNSKQTQGAVTHNIRMRYDATLRPSPSWKIVYNARDFEVLSWILVDERNREIVISAREMV